MKYVNMNPDIQQKVKKLYEYYVNEMKYKARNKFKLPFITLFHIGCIIWLVLVTMIMTIWDIFHIPISSVFNLYFYEDSSSKNRKMIDCAAVQINNQIARICYLVSLIICDTRYIFTRDKYDMFLIHFLEYFNSEQMQELLPNNYKRYYDDLIEYDNEQLFFAKDCIRLALFYKIEINEDGQLECR